MNNQTIRNTVAELQDLYAAQDLLKAQITEREQAIKEEMENRELEELNLVYTGRTNGKYVRNDIK